MALMHETKTKNGDRVFYRRRSQLHKDTFTTLFKFSGPGYAKGGIQRDLLSLVRVKAVFGTETPNR